MKKYVLIVLGLLASLAVGAAGGYAVGRHRFPGSPGDAKTAEAAPDWQEWKYAGSSEHDSLTGGGTQTSSGAVPPHFCLVMTTEDDYEKVLRYYADKTGVASLEAGGSGGGTRFNFGPNGAYAEEWFVLNDSRSPNSANQDRPVKMKMFGRRTLTYDLTMLISRANDEKHTHIVLAFYPRK
jgi:hypothetical protein